MLKALDISSATVRVVPNLLKAPPVLSDTTVGRSAVEKAWNHSRYQKRGHISGADQKASYL